VFLSEECVVSKVTTSVRSAIFLHWHRPAIVPPLYCLVDDTLFEVSPEIRCSVCQVATVVMETTQPK